MDIRRVFAAGRTLPSARGLATAGKVLAGAALIALAAVPALAQPQRPVAPAAQAPAAAPATPLPPRPAAVKTFQRPDLITESRRYERELQRTAKAPSGPLDRARRDADQAFQRGDARSAAALYGALAVAVPQEFNVWMRLARALGAIKANDDENASAFTDNAAGAAYIAYRRATTQAEEGEALAFIGRIYAGRSLWAAAIETMKVSLALRENAAERAFYEKLRDEHGFRMVNYRVESDAAAPRACISFSEPLAANLDVSPFVQVAGVDKPALSAEEQQICVEGLKHGESYVLRVRPGIPAVTGEVLRRPVELSIYVRDRSPSVRFGGKAYVLPSVGQKGIPLVTVNTAAVQVDVVRVGDRGLIPNALSGDFQNRLSAYEFSDLRDGKAIKVFSGTLEVENPLNRDVTTAVPVGEAVGKLEPGVYVMLAKPKGASTEDDFGAEATQWFIVSDLGLTALSGQGGVTALVRSLASAAPVRDAEVKLVARSNEVLGTTRTDADGRAAFDAGLARGTGGLEPFAVVARTEAGDYAFLSLRESAFDLTDRGVAGRETPGALDAFVTPERGVYRSGETAFITVLLRDGEGRAVPSLPLTVVLQRPDGVEDRRLVAADAGAGGRVVKLPLLSGAMTGTWRGRAFADPKGQPVGEAAFLVEDYVPDRLAFELSAADAVLQRNRPTSIKLDGRFLFGAPAAGLDVEGDAELRLAEAGRKAFPGYQFGNAQDEVLPQSGPIADTPRTDARGTASLQVWTPSLPRTDRPLEVLATVRLLEPGGRAVSRTLALPVAAAGPQIGVKPLFTDRVREGEEARFEIIVADAQDKRLAAPGLRWQLSRIETRYQWYRSGGSWDYEPVKIVTRVGEGRLDVPADGPARLAAPVEYGHYRLDFSGDGLPLTSMAFDAGFGGSGPDTPDKLELVLDRSAYAAGDTLEATLTARAAGTATLLVMTDTLQAQKVVQVAPGANKASFKVEPGWGPGAYLVALMHRPLDAAASRMPGRAIGLAHFSVDRAARTLAVEMTAPAEMRPGNTLEVPVKVGVKPGEIAFVTVAAVDVGILNLTGFKPPQPDAVIFGQRRLAAEVRDLYGALIDGMQGQAGRLRSGGDDMGGGLQSSPPVQPPLALFSGPVAVGPDGVARVSFPIPAFDGTVRLMAMAWSADRLGHASADVVVRDKVVILATLPRFLAYGDRSTLNLDLTNVEAPAGSYTVAVNATGAAGAAQPAGPVRLGEKERQSLRLALDGRGIGPAQVDVRLTGQGVDITRSFALNVRPAYPDIERRTVRNLAPGESLTVSDALVADLVAGTGAVAVSVTPSSAIDVPALLAALDRYPYGCSEQITSRALPLLYYNDLAPLVSRAPDPGADGRIREAVVRLFARQGSDGSFGLWSAGGEDTWLDAYVVDFLTRAKEKGFAVPEPGFGMALDHLRNVVNMAGAEMRSASEGHAYALYVLARNGRAPLGDLRYLADTRLEALPSTLARGQVGAALALLGDRTRAERVFNVALAGLPAAPTDPEVGRADFGSVLRDAAALTVLAREAGMERLAALALSRVDAARVRTERTSTQENAWLILAARELAESAANIVLDVNGGTSRGPFGIRLAARDLTAGPTVLRNRGSEPVKVVLGVQGSPAAPEPAIARGFTVERRYFTLDGKPFDPAKAVQNQRFAVVLKATEAKAALADVLMVDYLPAGFEIENPSLSGGSEEDPANPFAWLGTVSEHVHVEARDDRFVASVTRSDDDEPFVVAYVARAVSPGRYVHPPVMIEDMYRPDRFARSAAGIIEVAPAR